MLDDVGYFRETCVRRALQTEPLVPRWCYRDATSHLPWRNRDVETGETGEAGDVTISFSSLESFGLDEAYIGVRQSISKPGRSPLGLENFHLFWDVEMDMHICRWIIWIMRIVWIRWILSCLSTIIAIFWKSPRVRTIYVAVLHQVSCFAKGWVRDLMWLCGGRIPSNGSIGRTTSPVRPLRLQGP